MKIFCALLLCMLVAPAHAEELERFPGWKLNKIEAEESTDGSYATGPDYFGLTPPDSRPAISINSRLAAMLRKGEIDPESVYGKNASPQEAQEDEYELSGKNNGYVTAGVVESTLPGYERKAANGGEAGVIDGGAPQVFARGGNGSGNGEPTGALPSGSGSHGNSTAYSVKSAGEILAKKYEASKTPERTPSSSSASSFNLGQDNRSLELTGLNRSGETRTDTPRPLAAVNTGNTSANPTVPGSPTVTPGSSFTTPPPAVCVRKQVIYDQAGQVPVTLPEGCKYVLITSWGGGGGNGAENYRVGRDGMDQLRPIRGDAASFMSTGWKLVAGTYDLIVVVGGAGTNSAGVGTGGNGGNTLVQLVSKDNPTEKFLIASAAGGAGGGRSGNPSAPSIDADIPGAQKTGDASQRGGRKPGGEYYPNRGNAGGPGGNGRVVLEYY